MITRLSLRNFKAFGSGEVTFDFRPLTIFVGANSSGKSSVAQSLLAMKQTIDSRDSNTPFITEGPLVRLGSYSDLVHRHDLRRRVGISVSFETPTPLMALNASRGFNTSQLRKGSLVHLDLQLHQEPEANRVIAESQHFRVPDGDFEFRRRRGRVNKDIAYRRGGGRWLVGTVGPSANFHRLSVDAVRLDNEARKLDGYPVGFEAFFNGQRLEESIESAFAELRYVGPVRERFNRWFVGSGETPADVGVDGGRTASVIASRLAAPDGHRFLSQINRWLRRLGIARGLVIENHEGLVQLSLTDSTTRTIVNVADVGFGASQLIPVLVEGLHSPRGSTLVIEQPEIHLHPAAQGVLSDFLQDCADAGRTMIVETHSEHIIQRLQRRIAEGRFSAEDAAIYYFQKSPSGTKARRIEFDGDGTLVGSGLPDSFFDERFQDAVAMERAKRVKRASDS